MLTGASPSMWGASRLAAFSRLWHLRREGNSASFFAGVDVDAETVLDPPVRIERHTRIRESHIGRYTYIGEGSTLLAAHVGRFCSSAWGVTLGASAHHLDRATTHTFPWLPIDGGFVDRPGISVEPLHVGHDVWIGCNAVVLSGLTVGHGAVIAAGAVVTSDVSAYAVVAGVPAKTVRLRYSEQLASRLSALLWWEWPDEVLRRNVKLFQSPLDESVIEEARRVWPHRSEVASGFWRGRRERYDNNRGEGREGKGRRGRRTRSRGGFVASKHAADADEHLGHRDITRGLSVDGLRDVCTASAFLGRSRLRTLCLCARMGWSIDDSRNPRP